jgi:hypothetical protein
MFAGESSQSLTAKVTQSSLPLQMLIYFNWHYIVFYFWINLALLTFKAARYYYPGRYLGWDIVIIFLYVIVEATRLLFASKGNKTSQIAPLITSIILALPIIVMHAYYIELQTYVLRVDVVINAIAFFMLGSEVIVSILVLVSFIIASRKF